MIQLSDDNQPCDLSGLAQLSEWQALPQGLQEFLEPLLGQYLDPNTIPAPDHGRTNVRYFLDPEAMKLYLHARPEMSRLGLLPIAEDDCGNCFCVSVRGKRLGFVYFWDDDSVLDLGIERLVIADTLPNFFAQIKYDNS